MRSQAAIIQDWVVRVFTYIVFAVLAFILYEFLATPRTPWWHYAIAGSALIGIFAVLYYWRLDRS